MHYQKGQRVWVTDYRGKKHLRRVWAADAHRVYVTNDEVFDALVEGNSELWPIAFPRADVSPEGDETKLAA